MVYCSVMTKGDSLGRALTRKPKKDGGNRSDRHTTEYGLQHNSTRSVTEETSLTEFMNMAQLANADFTAQRKTFRFVSASELSGVPPLAEQIKNAQIHRENRDRLKIPRRPKWTTEMTVEELNRLEKDEFLKWRRELVKLEQTDGITLTPFEKNLEFWRQLWRVVDRSDVVVQIVDARQPLLYYCRDLETLVQEVDPNKRSVVLINKADLLSPEQCLAWRQYFQSAGIDVIFFSAAMASQPARRQDTDMPLEQVDEAEEEEAEGHVTSRSRSPSPGEALDDQHSSESDESTTREQMDRESYVLKCEKEVSRQEANSVAVTNNGTADTPDSVPLSPGGGSTVVPKQSDPAPLAEESCLLNAEQLLDFLSNAAAARPAETVNHRRAEQQLTIGFVGYPNVGKSSTLNALMGCKKTAVSQTPGRTKHLQTLYVRDNLILCDCPGLVMPSFVHSKADLVVAGILSIDQMRDCVHPIGIICEQIPRHVLEFMYGINLSKPKISELADSQLEVESPPTPYELLTAHALSHGFRASMGNPHYDRSARLILKDYVQGRLLYCHPPPDMDANAFQRLGRETALLPPSLSHLDNAAKRSRFIKMSTDPGLSEKKPQGLPSKLVKDFDQLFFNEMESGQKSRMSSHVRSNKRLLVSREQLAQAGADGEDVDETGSCLSSSSSSWMTVASTVGGRSLLSGTEYLKHSRPESTVPLKPWRIVSQSKEGPLEANGGGGAGRRSKKVKRKEKLRRVYAHLDRVDEAC